MLHITLFLLHHMIHNRNQLDGAETQQSQIAPHLSVLLPALFLTPRRHTRLLLHPPKPIHHTALHLILLHTLHSFCIHHHIHTLRCTLPKHDTRLTPMKPSRHSSRHFQHLLHLPALQSVIPRYLHVILVPHLHGHHPLPLHHVSNDLVEYELLRLQLQQRPCEGQPPLLGTFAAIDVVVTVVLRVVVTVHKHVQCGRSRRIERVQVVAQQQ